MQLATKMCSNLTLTMNTLVLLSIFAFGYVENFEKSQIKNTAFGYLNNVGVPLAEERRLAEEKYLSDPESRIVGSFPATLGQYPWQAGLLINLIDFEGTAICGGSLISNNRLVTAGHCWYDGMNQAWRFTVVLGSVLLFSGGTRIETSVVAPHPKWIPLLIRNDIAVVYLPTALTFTNMISPISLPSGSELKEDFAGVFAVASGFGLTSDNAGITTNQFLSHAALKVISNKMCSIAFPFLLQESNICTSGLGGAGTCSGDSGGPLVTYRNEKPILIGITSFGSAFGCQSILPAAYTRVTSYINFIKKHIN